MTALYQLSTQRFHFPYMKLSRFFGLLGSLVFLAIVPSCENPIATEEPQVEKETNQPNLKPKPQNHLALENLGCLAKLLALRHLQKNLGCLEIKTQRHLRIAHVHPDLQNLI